MSPRYPAPEIKDLPEDIRAKVLEVQEKAGFVPNVFLAFARRPAEWRAFFAYHDALMVPESVGRESGLSKGEREMIVTTTSAANNCLYCVVAHGAILRIRATIVKSVRDYFDSNGFLLVDSPIFTPNACEGTSTLFETK